MQGKNGFDILQYVAIYVIYRETSNISYTFVGKMIRETFRFGDLVCFILEVWWYV